MAMKVKWDVDGKGDEAWGGDFKSYDGPVPPKGNYVCRVKRMTVGAIKSGDNKGKPRISVLLEVVGGAGADGIDDSDYKYLGAPIWDGLNIIKSQTGKVNNFLHALTDGSDSAKRAVETAFWPPNGPKADKVKKEGKPDVVHIVQIGKHAIGSPDGQLLVRVVTKMGRDLEKNPRAEVSQYLPYQVKGNNGKPVADDDEDADVDEDVEDDDIEDDDDDLEIEYEDDEDEDIEDASDDEPPF